MDVSSSIESTKKSQLPKHNDTTLQVQYVQL